MAEKRIGVFICECGTNISEVIDTTKIAEFAAGQKDVAEVKTFRLWCSEEGREGLKRIIQEKRLSHVVMAACSPKQHELTFQKVLISAGLNPYLLQMVNVREQVAWVTTDKNTATQKAVVQLRAALKRVALQ